MDLLHFFNQHRDKNKDTNNEPIHKQTDIRTFLKNTNTNTNTETNEIKQTNETKEENQLIKDNIELKYPLATEGKTSSYDFKNYYIIQGSIKTCKTPSLIQFDGASDPNPGPSCGAAVVYSTHENTSVILAEGGIFLDHGTNNVAEYRGLLYGLELAKKKGLKQLFIEGDSKLVVLQMAKKWQVKDVKMRHLWEKGQQLLNDFDFVAIKHIYREFNEKADALSKEGTRRKISFERI